VPPQSPHRLTRLATAVATGAALLTAAAGTATASTPLAPRYSGATPPLAYSVLTAGGEVVGFGGAFSGDVAAEASPVAAVAATPDGRGAFAAEADGGVVPLGDAVSAGSMAGRTLVAPVVGIAVNPVTGGYWMVASDGGIFSFGGAPFYGSMGNRALPSPVTAMATTPTGHGYWLATATGAIYPFGDAQSFGSLAGIRLNKPIVGISPTADGRGYWMVASDGGIFNFGDAGFYGSTGGIRLNAPVIGMAPTTSGHGYWMVAADGGIFNFGDAPFDGSAAGMGTKIVGMTTALGVNPIGPLLPVGRYLNPFRVVALTPMRIDEGVDYGGNGPVFALGDGVVLSTTGPWPGGAFTTYRLTDGPAAGKLVYLAENVTPSVTVGQTVTPNTVIGQMHASYPYIETGWATDQYGDTMAAVNNQWTAADDSASLPTAYGINFNQLLVSLGAPSGVFVHTAAVGALPPGWPSW
jgi:hypothetical protein